MKRTGWHILVLIFTLFVIGAAELKAVEDVQPLILFDFSKGFGISMVRIENARVRLSGKESLLMRAVGDQRPNITLKAPEGHWDLSKYLYVTMDIHNHGTETIEVCCRVDNNKWVDGSVCVPGGETRTLSVLLKRNSPPDSVKKHLFGMNGFPGGYVYIWEPIEMLKIRSLVILLERSERGQIIEIDNVRATGAYDLPSEQEFNSSFFPCIDTFGQYIHKDWPGKIHSVEELAECRRQEAGDLVAHPGPAGWNLYGSWSEGPQLDATGHFRVEKYEGKWWLVDPEGRLFWSHGITCVRSGNATPISDREHYFKGLPESGTGLAKFYSTGDWAPHGYYKGRSSYKVYDFSQANLFRKCGEDWRQKFANITHQRLRSWGVNTIANWSDPDIYLMRKTPYVTTLGSGGRSIEGATGHWRKFPDPFDDSFKEAFRIRLGKEKDKSANDPWCIGYFVDNELTWGDTTFLALGAIASGADQPVKKVFVKELRVKYKTIEKLNAAWGTNHDSWEALLESREEPDREKARAELIDFNSKIVKQYFKTIRDIIREMVPKKLYLGCRFDFHFYPAEQKNMEWLVTIAAEYCDIVSFNRYRFSGRGLVLPAGIDKPIIIGEWHMGAIDRGMFHTGLRSVANQDERGQAYASYVRGSLENPYLVGVHWFQYKDQPTTGRGDGENYQIGFVDICDTPYPETVAACRAVGYGLYEYRLENN
ncbi:MAG: beta-galactosidase [Planctomycetota bacterium]|jgi:hypothetical protein